MNVDIKEDESNNNNINNNVNKHEVEPWQSVFEECCKNKTVANEKVQQCKDWNFSFECMQQATNEDRNEFCQQLNLDELQSKKFGIAVQRCLIQYSKFAFILRIMTANAKSAHNIVTKLNALEKPMQRITARDIRYDIICVCVCCMHVCVHYSLICESYDSSMYANDISSLISWSNVLSPINDIYWDKSLNGFLDTIAMIALKFSLPFASMSEATADDIKQLCTQMFHNDDEKFIQSFAKNVELQLRILNVMKHGDD